MSQLNDGSSSSIPHIDTIESIRLQLSTLVARIKSHVSIDTIRPLPIFLGLQGADGATGSNNNTVSIAPNAFTTPIAHGTRTRIEVIQVRVNDNIAYYMSNYALIAVMTAVVVILMHPFSVIITLLIVYGLWWCHSYLLRHELILFHTIPIHTILTVQQRFYALLLVSVTLIVITCIIPTIIFIIIAGTIVLCHAALRDTRHIQHEIATASSTISASTPQRSSKSNIQHGDDDEIDPLLSSPL
jgi:hypothetical protein